LNSQPPGIKVGLEIHRQLDTAHKLFCGCPTFLAESEPEFKFLRRLRPTQSELGQVDQAALFEFHRGRSILYESDNQTSCLVEMDEEPPGRLNMEAIETCLTAAVLVKANIVDEIHVMRKIVIDGSNTTGFQRTCVVALNGMLMVDGKEVPIQQISLEEDAARKTTQSRETVGYRIDRLGVPLIEVTTAPVMTSASEVEKVALGIGMLLRATGKVKRGLGSVRQDLNISIEGGALMEIKGVQELELLNKVVELEVNRQLILLKIREELQRRQMTPEQIARNYVDLSDIFAGSKARVIREALERNGVVLGVPLQEFGGLLGREIGPGLRLGTEMSNHASFWAGVGGIFHSDELPAYGISELEVRGVKERLRLGSSDAFVLVADEPSRARNALDAVVERAVQALAGVPDETRTAMPDGTSRYMRPRPGAARMYPETDVPSTPVTQEMLTEIREKLPETSDVIGKRLIEKYGLNQKLAKQLVDSDYLTLFEEVASSSKVQASFIATFLTEIMKSLEREGVAVQSLTDDSVSETFRLVDQGAIAKEAVADLVRWQAKNPNLKPHDGIKELGIKMLTEQELEQVVDRHLEKNRKLVEERRAGAFSSLMGSVMSEVRGSTDPKLVTELLKKKLAKYSKN
jgi:glutamyl-tRNA(Gln) amidotransferase subunit E